MAGRPTIPEFDISPEELRVWMESDKDFQFIDVRVSAAADAPTLGAKSIPLTELADRIGELDPTRELVVHCTTGGKSTRATEYLRANGFPNARNLAGGIKAWLEKTDSTV